MTRKIKITTILIVVLAVSAGAFYYLWYILPSSYLNSRQTPSTQAPTLFNKDDYQIVEKPDGVYIAVKKVGLTAKVPDGWTIEKQRTANINPEYWLEIMSPDIAFRSSNTVLEKGCRINLTIGTAEKESEEIEKNIDLLQKSPEESATIKDHYVFAESVDVVDINGSLGLKVVSEADPILGQGINISIPKTNMVLIDIGVDFPINNRTQCITAWENFLKSIKIE